MNLPNFLNGTIKKNGCKLSANGFFFYKKDFVLVGNVLLDNEPKKFTWEPNPGFSSSGANNPFKPLSFTCQAEMLGLVSLEVAEIVNFLLPWSARSYKQVPYDLKSRFFHPALSTSRLLEAMRYGYEPKVWKGPCKNVLNDEYVYYFDDKQCYLYAKLSRLEWQEHLGGLFNLFYPR